MLQMIEQVGLPAKSLWDCSFAATACFHKRVCETTLEKNTWVLKSWFKTSNTETSSSAGLFQIKNMWKSTAGSILNYEVVNAQAMQWRKITNGTTHSAVQGFLSLHRADVTCYYN